MPDLLLLQRFQAASTHQGSLKIIFQPNKKDCSQKQSRKLNAQKKTRTSTSLRTLVPETSASTNSAIWAKKRAL